MRVHYDTACCSLSCLYMVAPVLCGCRPYRSFCVLHRGGIHEKPRIGDVTSPQRGIPTPFCFWWGEGGESARGRERTLQ